MVYGFPGSVLVICKLNFIETPCQGDGNYFFIVIIFYWKYYLEVLIKSFYLIEIETELQSVTRGEGSTTFTLGCLLCYFNINHGQHFINFVLMCIRVRILTGPWRNVLGKDINCNFPRSAWCLSDWVWFEERYLPLSTLATSVVRVQGKKYKKYSDVILETH